MVVTVADGHGSVRSFRSNIGARLATAVANIPAQTDTALRTDVLLVAGNLALDQDDYTVARELFERALATAQRADYRSGVAYASGGLGRS